MLGDETLADVLFELWILLGGPDNPGPFPWVYILESSSTHPTADPDP